MAASNPRVLTDAASKTYLPSFELRPSDVPGTPVGWWVTKETLRGGLRDGVDLIGVCNGPLTFWVLPTRGMGLWKGRFRDIELGWNAPVRGPVHPAFVNLTDRNGIGWLAGFDEWLCRCGLASNGPPGDDGGTPLTLHGRIANLPAELVTVSVDPQPPHAIRVTGDVVEGGMFLGQLRLRTSYETVPGSNRITIHDEVANLSAKPAEMQLLYHLNTGQPFLEAGSKVVVPFREMAPHTPHAAKALDGYDTYAGAVAGFAEEVYDFRPATDADGRSVAMLHNAAGSLGLVVRWSARELPCFTVWKNTAALEDGYVTGLEPATNFAYFKAHEHSQGRVRTLPPGGIWATTWSIEVLDSAAAVRAVVGEMMALRGSVVPIVHREPVFGPNA
jgi:hypothetical protein